MNAHTVTPKRGRGRPPGRRNRPKHERSKYAFPDCEALESILNNDEYLLEVLCNALEDAGESVPELTTLIAESKHHLATLLNKPPEFIREGLCDLAFYAKDESRRLECARLAYEISAKLQDYRTRDDAATYAMLLRKSGREKDAVRVEKESGALTDATINREPTYMQTIRKLAEMDVANWLSHFGPNVFDALCHEEITSLNQPLVRGREMARFGLHCVLGTAELEAQFHALHYFTIWARDDEQYEALKAATDFYYANEMRDIMIIHHVREIVKAGFFDIAEPAFRAMFGYLYCHENYAEFNGWDLDEDFVKYLRHTKCIKNKMAADAIESFYNTAPKESDPRSLSAAWAIIKYGVLSDEKELVETLKKLEAK